MHALSQDMTRPVRMDTLARATGMSLTNFYKYFKAVTLVTPLQYQKRLRLIEARQLLMAGATTVESVALKMGYKSPSQFSREYSRMFGAPPKRDVTQSRDDCDEVAGVEASS